MGIPALFGARWASQFYLMSDVHLSFIWSLMGIPALFGVRWPSQFYLMSDVHPSFICSLMGIPALFEACGASQLYLESDGHPSFIRSLTGIWLYLKPDVHPNLIWSLVGIPALFEAWEGTLDSWRELRNLVSEQPPEYQELYQLICTVKPIPKIYCHNFKFCVKTFFMVAESFTNKIEFFSIL